MCTCWGLLLSTAIRWQLRALVVLIGLVTWIFGAIIIIVYACTFMSDVTHIRKREPIWSPTGAWSHILTLGEDTVDAGLRNICHFSIEKEEYDYPVWVDQEGCYYYVERERQWQKEKIQEEQCKVFAFIECRVQRVFMVFDIIMILLGILAGVLGFLLIYGAIWKRHLLLVPWLLGSFTVAWGPVVFGVVHFLTRYGWSALLEPFMLTHVLACFLVACGLHALAFCAVVKFAQNMWQERCGGGCPETIRTRLTLSRLY